jgi:predicted ATP-dependent protease
MADIQDRIAEVSIGRFGLSVKLGKTQQGTLAAQVALTLDGQPIDEKIAAEKGMAEAYASAAAQAEEMAQPFVQQMVALLKQVAAEEQELEKRLENIDSMVVGQFVKRSAAQPLMQLVEGNQRAEYYVAAMAEYATQHYQDFMPQTDNADKYRVNLFVDNAGAKGAPVIWEDNPSYENLFGMAAPGQAAMAAPGMGMLMGMGGPAKARNPEFVPGSFHKANGGFLIVDAMALLQQPAAWPALMQAVRTGMAEITEGGLEGKASMKGRQYQVPARVKIILLGSPMLKSMLREHDPFFAGAFPASAEFESSLPITPDNVAGYVDFFVNAVKRSAGALMDLSRDAMSALLQQSARMTSGHTHLSAQFGALYGLLHEANFWAKEAGHKEITGEDIATALTARRDREEPYIKRTMDKYLEGIFHVGTSGSEVGQINGLAVMGSFGVPARITVTVGAGEGLRSVDQEAGVAGPTFIKALGVVRGFLNHTFAQKKKLPAALQVSFEQNYGGIDGDSATSTQIYATLSALSGVPIKQTFAVTGSADQFGNVQAIGGANEKIEGYFALAKARGLTGEHGIIIPADNVADLQLSPEVVQAVKDGKFHIYAVSHVSQGLEILTGAAYPTILQKAAAKLEGLRAGA